MKSQRCIHPDFFSTPSDLARNLPTSATQSFFTPMTPPPCASNAGIDPLSKQQRLPATAADIMGDDINGMV